MADVRSLAASPHFKLVAVADVDLSRTGEIKSLFPDVKVYQDWRELLDKEKGLDSVNVSIPDHMHAPIAMSALQRGLHVYGQKPLTQTIYEARRLTEAAARSLRLKGYVRNLNDGRVEVYAIGNPASLENLKRQMELGPPASRVERIEERTAPSRSRYSEFVIEASGEPSA